MLGLCWVCVGLVLGLCWEMLRKCCSNRPLGGLIWHRKCGLGVQFVFIWHPWQARFVVFLADWGFTLHAEGSKVHLWHSQAIVFAAGPRVGVPFQVPNRAGGRSSQILKRQTGSLSIQSFFKSLIVMGSCTSTGLPTRRR